MNICQIILLLYTSSFAVVELKNIDQVLDYFRAEYIKNAYSLRYVSKQKINSRTYCITNR